MQKDVACSDETQSNKKGECDLKELIKTECFLLV